MTPFEQRLARTPQREIPEELRARILAAAQPRQSFSVFLISTIKQLLSFPHPVAWGAVAACWAVIAALNFSGPQGDALAVTPKDYKGPLPSAREYFVHQAEQQKLLLALATDSVPAAVYRLRAQDL